MSAAMMATQPYPSPQMPSAPNTGSRNIHRVNTSNPPPSPGPPSGGGVYYQQQPYLSHYHHQQPDVSAYGLVTPPATNAAPYGSPLMPQGYYGSNASSQWSMNGLVSPISSDGMSLPGYYVPSPMLGNDGHCAAPREMFTGQPMGTREPMPTDALGFTGMPMHHHHQMYGVPTHMGGKLGQHLVIGPDGQPTQPEIKKRSRTAQACERCRIRKARCFGGNPCNRCQKRRFVCEFSTAVRQRGPNKPFSAAAADPTSTPATATTAVNAVPSAPGSATLPQKPLSIDTKSVRRHSSDSVTQAAPNLADMQPMPAKGYSTNDVPLAQSSTADSGYPISSALHLTATPTTDYLGMPNGHEPGQAGQAEHGYFPEPSPVFSFPAEGEFPISPANNFSPANSLAVTNGDGISNGYAQPQHDQPQTWYTTTA